MKRKAIAFKTGLALLFQQYGAYGVCRTARNIALL